MKTFWKIMLMNGQIIECDKVNMSDDNKNWYLTENVKVISLKSGVEVLSPEQAIVPTSSVLYMIEEIDKPKGE